MKNSACYWKLEKFSLRYVHYAFVDTQPYLADQLFCDHQVTVRFGEEYGKGDTDYRILPGSSSRAARKAPSSPLRTLQNTMR